MNDVTSFCILIGIGVSAALVCHWLIRRYVVASLCAAVIADIAFQFGIYLEVGYRDPFFPISLVTGGVIFLLIALIVGFPFLSIRKKRKDGRAA